MAITITRTTTAAQSVPPLRPRPRTWTLTATLVAAQLQADGAIDLIVADPDNPRRRRLMTLPAGGDDPCATDPALRARVAASRETFIREIVLPSFEGYILLYGEARLTLVAHGDGASRRSRYDRDSIPHVLDFVALDSRPPAPALARCA